MNSSQTNIQGILSEKDSIWRIISNKSKDYENGLNAAFKRSNGIYYTDLVLADYMVDELFKFKLLNPTELQDKLFLEPCVGTGNFVFSYLKKISQLKLSKQIIRNIINNIYVNDIDANAINVYKEMFTLFCKSYFDIKIDASYFKERVGTGLLFNVDSNEIKYRHIKDVFPNVAAKGGFDIIITNPPYKNLKAERNKYSNQTNYDKDKKKYAQISSHIKNSFTLSADGVLNLYKLFVEDIFKTYSNMNSVISLLIPSTILTDKTCEKLRNHLLEYNKLYSVNTINENNPYLNAQQAVCTLLVKKGGHTDKFFINNSLADQKTTQTIDFQSLKDPSSGNPIYYASDTDYSLIKTLKTLPIIRDLKFIINKRGELDLTAHKSYMTSSKTKLALIRGKNIGLYNLNTNENTHFVNPDFLNLNAKSQYINSDRIACQQVSNIHKERRLIFSFIEKGNILANSCNFIMANNNSYNIDIYVMLGLLNSKILNWYFKLTSSNNHINNYEIDSFPIPVKSKFLPEIGKKVKEYLQTGKAEILKEIDALSYKAYDLTESRSAVYETKYYQQDLFFLQENNLLTKHGTTPNADNTSKYDIDSTLTTLNMELDTLNENITKLIVEKSNKIEKAQILNHTTFKLSKLDMQMIENVPQGGNWKNIPKNIVNKSQRLIRITETGGRTTLYGRLDLTKPSYTITTYFNRPGNGTYVHPIHDRVISVREAARLQSFKDDYYFTGNKVSLLKQVGNAVPPLLAFAIANKIKGVTGFNTSFDLFCGAGGMTAGFEEAGIKTLLGTDFDESACTTYKINNPEVKIICGDITDPIIKQQIFLFSQNSKPDIIAGGPPCQGFSHAGKRFVNDPRNKLFKDFVAVIKEIKPKLFIMENVEGIRTLAKGEIYNGIIKLFNSLGYNSLGRILHANEYGVPQKRKRVIIIGTRNDLKMDPEMLFPGKTTPEPLEQVTVKDAIEDLLNIECLEESYYKTIPKNNNYIRYMRGIIPVGKLRTSKQTQ